MQYFFVLLFCYSISSLSAQAGRVEGSVTSNNQAIAFATVYIENTSFGTTSDINGNYQLQLPPGDYELTIKAISYRVQKISITITENQTTKANVVLIEDVLGLNEVVVSATRNRVERKTAPIVVSSIKPQLLSATQSLSLADGLNFAPGVRVENNCQNCGFTQVRLNGLDGSYTQILLNSRPVFTSLLGVYGLEQIPTNIIERVEVVRSGGSALFGSNAIAGTINVITKDPIENSWEIGSNLALIDGSAIDRNLNFNTSIIADDLNSGVTFFGTHRNRDSFDANDDGFTEIVELKNTTIGGKAFLKPNELSRISVNLNAISEYRRGGDRLDLAPQFTDITEELDHDTFIGGADYEINNKDYSNTFQIYTSASITNRDSYYGGLGGARTQQDSILANNAFGNTKDFAWVNGLQNTKRFKNNDVLTAGVEYIFTNTEDIIPGYNRNIDQSVSSLGAYAQYEWKPNDKLTLMAGTRLDYVSVDGAFSVGGIARTADVNETVLSPRITLSYKVSEYIRLRGGYARGFRAPQAFNEDLHISSVGGEPQFTIISNNLESEFSNAYTASFNYSKNSSKSLWQVDILAEGFYTTLQNPFTIVSTGAVLSNGSILEEVRNGSSAEVYGTNIEIGWSPHPKWQFQFGGTIQDTKYNETQVLFETDGLTPGETDITIEEFVRVPNLYGYLNAGWKPSRRFDMDITGTYTGSMTVPLVVSDTGFLQLNEVNPFFDLNMKLQTHFKINNNFTMTLSGGVRNMFNSYQDDFDLGPTRDSDYVYGPANPRTFFIGLKFGK